MESCDLFIWDDELDQVHGRNENPNIPINCNDCEMIMAYLREFGTNIDEEFLHYCLGHPHWVCRSIIQNPITCVGTHQCLYSISVLVTHFRA